MPLKKLLQWQNKKQITSFEIKNWVLEHQNKAHLRYKSKLLWSRGTTRLRLKLPKRSHWVHELHWDWKAKGIQWRPNYQETQSVPQGTLLLIKLKIALQWGYGYKLEIGCCGIGGAGRIYLLFFNIIEWVSSNLYVKVILLNYIGCKHVTYAKYSKFRSSCLC